MTGYLVQQYEAVLAGLVLTVLCTSIDCVEEGRLLIYE